MSNSARDKFIIMESKIFIDINYASRSPQIVIRQKDSEDPRDKITSMFINESMPGVRDGYCRIERYADDPATYVAIITPVHPVDMINHIQTIAKFAHENAAVDTSKVPEQYRQIIKEEFERLGIGGVRKNPWTNAFKNNPPDNKRVSARYEIPEGYSYTQLLREGENVFVGDKELEHDTMYLVGNEMLKNYEWLEE